MAVILAAAETGPQRLLYLFELRIECITQVGGLDVTLVITESRKKKLLAEIQA